MLFLVVLDRLFDLFCQLHLCITEVYSCFQSWVLSFSFVQLLLIQIVHWRFHQCLPPIWRSRISILLFPFRSFLKDSSALFHPDCYLSKSSTDYRVIFAYVRYFQHFLPLVLFPLSYFDKCFFVYKLKRVNWFLN